MSWQPHLTYLHRPLEHVKRHTPSDIVPFPIHRDGSSCLSQAGIFSTCVTDSSWTRLSAKNPEHLYICAERRGLVDKLNIFWESQRRDEDQSLLYLHGGYLLRHPSSLRLIITLLRCSAINLENSYTRGHSRRQAIEEIAVLPTKALLRAVRRSVFRKWIKS